MVLLAIIIIIHFHYKIPFENKLIGFDDVGLTSDQK